jgi:ribulose-phosphate 3-epimerase
MIQIIPAILTDNVGELTSMVKRVDEASWQDNLSVSKIQFDVIDGIFVENKTVDPSNMGALETDLGLDFHLMVKDPINWVEKCANAGADRILGQIEMMTSQLDFVGRVQETGLYVGLAVDIETPISDLDPVVLTSVDVVLLMAVKAGWGGQSFDKKVLDKIRELDEIRARDKTPFRICVDGGETIDVVDDTHFAGADEVAIGRRIFEGDIAENIRKMQQAAHRIS